MNIVVDDLLVHYELSGKGPLLMLLHGWGDTGAGLKGLAGQLKKDYQVLVPDLPGFGNSQAPSTSWDLDDYALFLTHLLQKLQLKRVQAIIGHSNGGSLAIRATSLQAVRPKQLVLIAASGVRTQQRTRRLVLQTIAKTGNLATVWLPERHRRALRRKLYSASGSDMLVAPQLEATFKRIVRQDVQADAAQLEVPVLLIYAGNDQAAPVANGQIYRDKIAAARLEVIADAGHFVHLEKPRAVYNLIEEFLQP